MSTFSTHFSLLKRSGRAVALLLVSSAFLAACGEDPVTPPAGKSVADYDAGVATSWSNMQLELVQKTPGFTPMVAARSFGYSGVALYEALVAGMPENRSLEGQLNGLNAGMIPDVEEGVEYHWPSVANAAMARITDSLFANAKPEMIAKSDSLQAALAASYVGEADSAVLARSVAYGTAVADAVYEYSKSDGGHQAYDRNFPAYTPPVGDGKWVPTPRKGGLPAQGAMQPTWGQNRPFVLTPGNPNDASDPGEPMAYSTEPGSPFYMQAQEIHGFVTSPTTEQTEIALFWSDDPGTTCTPAGHSVSILTQCVEAEAEMLDAAALCYAQVGIAVNDAFIACWESKFKYNLMRPITYFMSVLDPTFTADDLPLGTPPFPEYPSGHSVQSGAASVVLNSGFGMNFAFTDNTHAARGLSARSYASFDAAANEAAVSRLYGGIHFREACEKGVTQGQNIGQQVLTSVDWTN